MTSEVNISIIIVNYNCFDLIDNCLSSIMRFTTGCSFEIIVVDNHSNEDDVEKVTSKYPNIILIKNDSNIGFSAANNIGLGHAHGEYVLFLNNDTVFHENSLKLILEFAEELDHEVFVGCKLLNADGTHQISLVDFDTITNSFGENFFLYKLFPRSKVLNRFHSNYNLSSDAFEVDVVKGALIFCSSNALKKLNGFDTSFFFFGEETDLCQRFKRLGGKVYYFPSTSIYHVGGASTNNNPWFRYKNQSIAKIQIYQKNYTRIESFLLQALHFLGMAVRVPVYFFAGILSLNSSLLIKSFCYFRTLFIYPKNRFN